MIDYGWQWGQGGAGGGPLSRWGNFPPSLPSSGKRVPAGALFPTRLIERVRVSETKRDLARLKESEAQRESETESERARARRWEGENESSYIYIYSVGLGINRGGVGDTLPIPAPSSDGYSGNVLGLTPTPGQTGDSRPVDFFFLSSLWSTELVVRDSHQTLVVRDDKRS